MLSFISQWYQRRNKCDTALQPFIDKKLPIFWIIGPRASSKTTTSEMLAKSSKYHLISINKLSKEEMLKGKWNTLQVEVNQNITLLREEFIRTHQNSIGYIIDGFPTNVREAKLFERTICKVNVIIYLTLELDALLSRRVTQLNYFDIEEERIQYVESVKNINQILKKYKRKVIEIPSSYPPEDTCTKLVETLEDYWGYKFMRLYNKRS